MAAGRGTRISRHIHGKPKCCVEFGGEPIIHRTVRVLNEMKINEIGIVTGYKSGEVLKRLEEFQVVKFYNPFFDITNSIVSLWFARDFFSTSNDVMIMNADLFIEEALINAILHEAKLPLFLADSSRKDEADYRFTWQSDVLNRFGKGIPDDEASGEYVGIGKISSNFIPQFIRRMDEMISSQQSGEWWEDVLYSFIGSGTDIYVKDIAGTFWAEIDYIEDFRRVENYLADKAAAHE